MKLIKFNLIPVLTALALCTAKMACAQLPAGTYTFESTNGNHFFDGSFFKFNSTDNALNWSLADAYIGALTPANSYFNAAYSDGADGLNLSLHTLDNNIGLLTYINSPVSTDIIYGYGTNPTYAPGISGIGILYNYEPGGSDGNYFPPPGETLQYAVGNWIYSGGPNSSVPDTTNVSQLLAGSLAGLMAAGRFFKRPQRSSPPLS